MATSLLGSLLGLCRLGIEALVWFLLLGGCLNYGWATEPNIHLATVVMLATGCYVGLLLIAGFWKPESFPGADRWLVAGVAISLYVALQVLPIPGTFAPEFPHSPSRPLVGPALRALDVAPQARLIAVDPYEAGPAARRFFAWVAFCLAMLHIARHRPVALRLLHGLTVFGFFQGCIGLRAFMNTEFAAATGTLYNRNHYGALMAMLLPLIFASLRVMGRASGSRGRPLLSGENPLVFAYLALPVAFAGLVASTSRGAFLFGSAAIAGYLIHQGYVDRHEKKAVPGQHPRLVSSMDRWRRWTTIFAVAFFVGCGLVALVFVFDQRGGFSALRSDDRLRYWNSGYRIFLDFPLFGIGPGAARRLLNIYTAEPSVSEIIHFHNDWFEFAIQAGIVGSLLAATLVLRAILESRRAWLTTNSMPNSTTQIARRGALWSVVAGLATSLSDFHLRVPMVGVVFALSIALAVSFGWRSVAPDSVARARRLRAESIGN